MTWQTNGPGSDGWEALGTPVTTDPAPLLLPQLVRARWFDPSALNGFGTLLPAVVLTVGNVAVEARQRGSRVEVTLTRREARGVALLDSLIAESLEGAPCSVVLTVYEDDRETEAWAVGTDPEHEFPYLVEPEDYGEQELDVAKGSCSIGTVRAIVVDRRTIPGDQDSGWMTAKLATGGFADLAGKRARMVRFIEPELGYQVIADGPAGTPALDASYAAFSFPIRDTRETERKSRITRGGDRSLLPLGVRNGYGAGAAGPGTWLIDPAAFITQTFQVTIPFEWGGWGVTTWVLDLTGEATALRDIPLATYQRFENVADRADVATQGTPIPYPTLIPADIVFEWRLSGPGAFNPVPISNEPIGAGGAFTPTAAVLRGTIITDTIFRVDRVHFNQPPLGAILGGPIDFRLLGGNAPLSKELPFYLEGITAGQFAKRAYDGEFSDFGPAGATVPTGIRYEESALLQMTDLVRMRLVEPVDDLRKWLEENIYAPTGWVPALDFDGRISPVSQNVPSGFAGLDAITNAIAEPAPEWTAGETIYNAVRFTYARDYKPTDPTLAEGPDGLAHRDIVIESEDPVSVARNSRQVLELAGVAFRAVGDSSSAAIVTLETGAGLAAERGLQMLNRYSLGAPTMQLAVMRRELPLLRAGEWVVVSLSWFPDYVTDRRGLLALAQVVALNDLDCAWRKVTLEVVNALAAS